MRKTDDPSKKEVRNMYGWKGAILRIDLTNGKITKQPLDETIARNFIGGRGLNSKTLFDEVKPGIDPLSPERMSCASLLVLLQALR